MNNKLIINTTLLRKESEFKTKACVVKKAIAVPHSEFGDLKRNPLQDNDLIADNVDLMFCDSDNNYHCLLIYDKEQGDGLLIESEGAPYARYSQYMQSVVGGCIEPIYFEPRQDAIVWCNDEFLLNDSAPNRLVGNCRGQHCGADLVYSTFYVSGNCQNEYGEWDSCSLTDNQIEKYTAMFETPVIVLEQAEEETEDFSESEEPEITMS